MSVCVVPGACSRPGPALSCAAGNGGVRSSGKSPKGLPSHPGGHRRGADRTGESREPPLMPRNCGAPLVGCRCGVQGLAAGKRQAPAGHGIRPGGAPPSPG